LICWKFGGDFTAEEGVSCLGLEETWAVFRYAWRCVLQFANRTKIVWEVSIEFSRIHENGQFPNSFIKRMISSGMFRPPLN
jgi:hypothetical protein